MTKTKKASYIINLIGLIVLFFAILGLSSAGVLSKYMMTIIMLVCINIVLAVSLNLTVGFLGQIALGHAGFMSIGAYAAALFSKNFMTHVAKGPMADVRFILALLVGGVAAACFGVIVGIPALRLKGDYLAIITLGFGEIIRVIIENVSFTGGAQGLRGIPRIANFSMVFWVTAICVAIMFAFVRSRHGRAIMAIREDDIASEASGIPNTYYKVLAFTLTAFFAGIAGAIYAHQYAILAPKTFGFLRSIELIVIVVLGGMGSITGSVIAAIGLTVLPEALRAFSEYRMLAYSVALIVVMIFKPSGLLGTYEFSLTGFLMKFQKSKDKKQKITKGGAEV
ncbi:branched-chain amino acid ABC transporter permease [Oscillospiraceae bacterium PP1C4]